MQERRIITINGKDVPVLISDEREALLAAKAAGRALIGLWRPEQEMGDLSAAEYVVEDPADATDAFVERVARRHLRLPWTICETARLKIREMYADDYDEVWYNRIGRGFDSVEALKAYTDNQYRFYEFGFWALVHQETGELVGMAGLTVPEGGEAETLETWVLEAGNPCPQAGGALRQPEEEASGVRTEAKLHQPEVNDGAHGEDVLELGYHIFPRYRRQGYAEEACRAILQYGRDELGMHGFQVRIAHDNTVSKRLAEKLGFRPNV